MALTLAQIKEQARNRADMKESEFISDPELNFYVNQSIKELHDILTDAYMSDYYMETYEFLSVGNQDEYALPNDFYELRGIDVKINNDDWFAIKKYNFNERVRYKNSSSWAFSDAPYIRYRLTGSNVRFNPAPDADNLSIRVWYTPKAQELVNDTDTFNDFNGFIEYVIVDVAIKMMQKEESDVTVLAGQKMALMDRIRNKAQHRDAAEADSVYDIYADDDIFWKTRS